MIMAMPVGVIIEPPSPAMMRKPMRLSGSQASPLAKIPATKITLPAR